MLARQFTTEYTRHTGETDFPVNISLCECDSSWLAGISSQSFDQRIHSCMAEIGRFEGGTLDHTVWVMVSM
jgi:hypothetical protein